MQIKQRVLPSDNQNDPNIHVEETLSFELSDSRPDQKDNLNKIPDWVIEGGLYVRVTLMIEDERDGSQHFLIGQLDDEGLFEGEDDVHTDEVADRLAMEMSLQGEDPDAEIDKLLETFDVQVAGNFSSKQFFNGEFLANDIRLGAELRELIGEIE